MSEGKEKGESRHYERRSKSKRVREYEREKSKHDEWRDKLRVKVWRLEQVG